MKNIGEKLDNVLRVVTSFMAAAVAGIHFENGETLAGALWVLTALAIMAYAAFDIGYDRALDMVRKELKELQNLIEQMQHRGEQACGTEERCGNCGSTTFLAAGGHRVCAVCGAVQKKEERSEREDEA